MEITYEFHFEAAHRLPLVPPVHKCASLHGHSYRVVIAVEGPVDEAGGWVMDFAELKSAMAPLLLDLDHHCLNEVTGLENPTSENLAVWIWERFVTPRPVVALAVTVRETTNSSCTYRGPEKN